MNVKCVMLDFFLSHDITQKTLNAVPSQTRDIQYAQKNRHLLLHQKLDADHLSYTFQMFTVQLVKLLPCVQNKQGVSECAWRFLLM